MKIVEAHFLRGPNLYRGYPCYLVILDMQGLDTLSSRQRSGFADRLSELMPTLQRQPGPARRTGGFMQRLRDGMCIAQVVERVALELQCRAGTPVSFGRTRRIRALPGHYRVVCAYQLTRVAEGAMDCAIELVTALARGAVYELSPALDALCTAATDGTIGAAMSTLIGAAGERGVPVLRIDEDAELFQLGWGSRQMRLQTDASGQVRSSDDTSSSGAPLDIESLFGVGRNGRIPLIAVTGTNGKTTTALLLAHALQLAGLSTGVTTTEGIFINDRLIEAGDCTGYWSARKLLMSPEVDAAVLETARGGILKRGLGFDRCDVGVVLNISNDHLGLDGVETLADMARVKALVARRATHAVVLNAEDLRCVAMARRLLAACEVIYFSMDPENAVLRRHLEGGGRAVYLQDEVLVLAHDVTRQTLLRAGCMPLSLRGRARHNIANALAAAAALVGAGYGPELIVSALSSFVSDARHNPKRGNLFQLRGITVLVDYAHNSVACRALCAMAHALLDDPGARLLGVVTAPGDRRAKDLLGLGRTLAAGFDELIVYESDSRGRAGDETSRLILQGARRAAPDGWFHAEPDVRDALALGLSRCRTGDMLVFTCAGTIDDLIEALRRSDPEAAERIATATRRDRQGL